VLSLYYVE